MFSAPAVIVREEVVVAISDVHHPFHDERKIGELKQILRHEKPTRLLILGDLHDMQIASRYVENALGKASNTLHRAALSSLSKRVADKLSGRDFRRASHEKVIGAVSEILQEESGIDLPTELRRGVALAEDIARSCGHKCKLEFIPGNHERRSHDRLNAIRHIVGPTYDPLYEAWQAAKLKWKVHGIFPHAEVVIDKMVFRHHGRGTGQHHAAACWRATHTRGISVVYGDTHKTLIYHGYCSSNPRERDQRFAYGLGTFADIWNDDGFGYATKDARSQWDCSFGIFKTKRSGRIDATPIFIA